MKRGFYDENDEISKNASAFTANQPNIWGNSRNATREYVLLHPMREIDEISIMAKVFANTLALYLAFLEISQMY